MTISTGTNNRIFEQHLAFMEKPSPERFNYRQTADVSMSPATRQVFGYLSAELVSSFQVCITHAQLARELSISKSSAARAIKTLRQLDLIETVSGRQLLIDRNGRKRSCQRALSYRLTYRLTADNRIIH